MSILFCFFRSNNRFWESLFDVAGLLGEWQCMQYMENTSLGQCSVLMCLEVLTWRQIWEQMSFWCVCSLRVFVGLRDSLLTLLVTYIIIPFSSVVVTTLSVLTIRNCLVSLVETQISYEQQSGTKLKIMKGIFNFLCVICFLFFVLRLKMMSCSESSLIRQS